MCLIVVGNKDNVSKQKTILENAFRINNNGFGLMYFKNDDVLSKKTLSKNFVDVENLIKSVVEDCSDKLALHFRFATQGVVDKINTHPITVLDKDSNGRSIKLMHNSPMLPTALIDKDRSDTHQFVKYYLRPVLKSNPDLLYNQKWLEQLNADCDSARMVFADGKTNSFIYVNKKLWEKKNKIWFSNDNCFSSYSWMSNISSGFGRSSNYHNSWDYADQENINYLKSDDAKQKPKGDQQKLFDYQENDPMDFLDMPLDDELLCQMDENQIADYVKNNNDEVINYLQQLKNDFFYNE
jgi:predicted glutamine amidotransferase